MIKRIRELVGVRRGRFEQAVTDEMRFHLDRHVEDLMREGIPAREAHRRARLVFGGFERAKDEYRAARRFGWAHDLLADLRHAGRLCIRQPAFAGVAVVILALGIGAATAVFTLVNAVLLRELPFVEPDRLVWMYNARTERDRAPFSIPDLEDYKRDANGLAGVAPFTNWTANLTGTGEAERLEGTRVAGNFFSLIGARAFLGRTLQTADEASPNVTVLTYGLWQRRFGSEPQIIGRPILLNGATYVVVGVLPQTFVFPFRYTEIAVPLALRDDARRSDRGANFLRVVARLRPGVTMSEAKVSLDTVARRLQGQFPDDDARKTGVNLYPLHREIVGDYRQLLWTLFGAVSVLLLVGCGNLANMLLVRAADRRVELTVRESLGASRGRIVRQLTAEALMVAALGALGGLVVANAAVLGWRKWAPVGFPRIADVVVDVRVLAFAGVLALVTALICGLVPAWCTARDLAPALADGSRTTTGGQRRAYVRQAFMVVQVAGSVVLLVCMGLVARGFTRLGRVDPGFTADHALTIQLSLPTNRYSTRESITTLYESLRTRLSAIPGTRTAGAVSLLPLSGLLSTVDLVFPDRPAPPPDEVPQAHFRIASADYFAAAGINVIAGRPFVDGDTNRGQPVAIVSRTFANRHWAGQPAVGKHVQIVLDRPSLPLEIVGVVSDVKQFDVDAVPTADLYVPIHQMPGGQAATLAARMYWVVRTNTDPTTLGPAIRHAVQGVDSDIATSTVRTLDDIVRLTLAPRRTNVWLLQVFGGIAVVLCIIGVYGMAAFSAGRRRRELAIRSAFGANRWQLASLMYRGELRTLLIGLVVGLAAAAGWAPTLLGVVFATSPWDPETYVAVAGVILVTGTIASFFPAGRAARANTAELLRG